MTQATLKQFRAEGGFKTNPSSNFGDVFATRLEVDGILTVDGNSISLSTPNQNLNIVLVGSGAVSTSRIIANQISASSIFGNLSGNVTGDLTGNVTGNLTGNVTGNLTGNVFSVGTSSFLNALISGGSITGTPIGNSNASTGNFTTLTANQITGTIGLTTQNPGSFTNLTASEQVSFSNESDSTSTSNGSVIVNGGIGIAKNVNIGENLNITGTASASDPVTNSNLANKGYVDRQDIKGIAYAVAFGL